MIVILKWGEIEVGKYSFKLSKDFQTCTYFYVKGDVLKVWKYFDYKAVNSLFNMITKTRTRYKLKKINIL